MHRIDAPGHVAGQFSAGNPAAGQRATQIDADWLNALQENICRVIEAAGLDLEKGDHDQLLTAITALIAAAGFAPTTGQIFSGQVGRDANFYLDLFGTLALLKMAANADFNYDRLNNLFGFSVDGVTSVHIGATGVAIGSGKSIKRNGNGKYVCFADGGVIGDSITRSTDAPSVGGGTDGDFHIQITGSGTMVLWHNYGGTWHQS